MNVKDYITLTVEFEYDAGVTDFHSIVASLVHKIGNIESDELCYHVNKVYSMPCTDAWEEDENWED